jgi:hypothetical protein
VRPTARIEQSRAEGRSQRQVDDLDRLAVLRQPGDEVAGVVDDERGAVEDQLVLAAHLVDVDDRGVGVLGTRGDHPLTLGLASTEVRRRVGQHDQLGATGALLEDRSPRRPGVLAHRDADPRAGDLVELERLGAGREVPLFVEHGVVGEQALVVAADDPSLGAHGGGVAQVAVGIGEAHDRHAATRGLRHLLEGSPVVGDEARSKQQVLGWVAGDGELGEDGQVALGGLGIGVRRQDALDVAGEVAHDGVELAQRHPDPEHDPSLGGS